MMMIVVDNKSYENPELLIMADDGRGSSVKIPSFLIGMGDGDKLKEAIHEEAAWEENQKEERKNNGGKRGEGGRGRDRDRDEEEKPEGEEGKEGEPKPEGEKPEDEEPGPEDSLAERWKKHKRRGWGQRVIIAAEIDLATKTAGTVNVDLWYANIYELMNSGWDLARFAEIQEIFNKKVQIQPRLITNSCPACTAEERKALCIQDGAYCPVIPTEFSGAAPKTIIDQNLRELCMFEAIPKDRKSLWFSYLNVIIQNCMAPDGEDAILKPVTPECHQEEVISLLKSKSFERLKIDWKKYESCIPAQDKALTKSAAAQPQSFLVRDMDLVKYVGSVFHPSISIENHTYRGDYKDANNVFKAICSTMTKRPPICSTVSIVDPFKPYMYEDYDQSPQQQKERADAIMGQIDRVTEYDENLVGLERRARLAEIILGLVIVVIINCACFAYCKVYNKKQTDERMQLAVNEQVSQYFALASEDPSAN